MYVFTVFLAICAACLIPRSTFACMCKMKTNRDMKFIFENDPYIIFVVRQLMIIIKLSIDNGLILYPNQYIFKIKHRHDAT